MKLDVDGWLGADVEPGFLQSKTELHAREIVEYRRLLDLLAAYLSTDHGHDVRRERSAERSGSAPLAASSESTIK